MYLRKDIKKIIHARDSHLENFDTDVKDISRLSQIMIVRVTLPKNVPEVRMSDARRTSLFHVFYSSRSVRSGEAMDSHHTQRLSVYW